MIKVGGLYNYVNHTHGSDMEFVVLREEDYESDAWRRIRGFRVLIVGGSFKPSPWDAVEVRRVLPLRRPQLQRRRGLEPRLGR